MLIRGNIDHVFVTDISGKRGPVTLTSVWIVDHHDHVPATQQDPTMYEIQFLDDKTHTWSDAITDHFDDGDRVLAIVRDDVETGISADTDGKPRTFIKARGIDLAHSALDHARK